MSVLSLQARQRASDLTSLSGVLAVATLAALAFGVMVQEPTRVRLAVSGAGCLLVFALGLRSPRHLLYTIIVWLTLVGCLRRIVSTFGPSSRTDPILLVGPLALGLLVLVAWKRGALGRLTFLGKAVLALEALIVLGALNPLQGSIVGGVAGLLFVLVPTLGFWIGRALCDDRTLTFLLRLVSVLALGVALYGLAQLFVGFTSWDEQWINSGAVGSLNVDGVIRPFGTMSSAAEYGMFLAVALIIWIAYWLRLGAAVIAVPAITLLAVAVFLESSRGLVVLCVVAIGVVLAAKARLPGIASLAVAALLLVGLGYGARHLASASSGTSKTSVLSAHQVSGLANPLDPNTSTATIHYSMLVNGLRTGLHNPIGQGIGVITIAGARFGGVTAGTELDPSNMAVSLGLPGLAAYLLIVAAGFRVLYRRARTRGDGLSVAALGVATVMAMQWLNGGQYSVAILPWLMLGWVDRPSRE